MRKRVSRRVRMMASGVVGGLVCCTLSAAHGAPPGEHEPPSDPQSDPPIPRRIQFGEWTVLDSVDGPDRADTNSWRVRADRIVRTGETWKLSGSLRAVSETTIVAAERGRLTPKGLTAEDASIHVRNARLVASTAELDARTDQVRLDRPGPVRTDPIRRSEAPEE